MRKARLTSTKSQASLGDDVQLGEEVMPPPPPHGSMSHGRQRREGRDMRGRGGHATTACPCPQSCLSLHVLPTLPNVEMLLNVLRLFLLLPPSPAMLLGVESLDWSKKGRQPVIPGGRHGSL